MNSVTDPQKDAAAYERWAQNKQEGIQEFDGVYELLGVYDDPPRMTSASARRRVYKFRDDLNRTARPDYLPPPPEPVREGLPPDTTLADEEAIWQRRIQEYERKSALRNAPKIINFDYGPVALAFFADLHLGGPGVDYAEIDRLVDMVLATPGMYIVAVGDFVDNFIVGPLLKLRLNTPVTIDEEWMMCRRVLRKMAPRLLASVAGNHDNWTFALAGIDYFKDVHDQLASRHVLYAPHEMRLVVGVGEAEHRLKIRHKWRGLSIYNPTHATERDFRFNRTAFDWTIGVAAHTHTGAYAREFNAGGGRTGLAVHCGTFKIDDDYATASGFPESNDSKVPVVVLGEDGRKWGTGETEVAVDYMNRVYSRNST